MIGDRLIDVGRGEVETDQLLRVDPDAHGTLGAIQLGLADPVDALDFVHHVARKVIAEGDLIQRAGAVGSQGHQHQKARGNFLDLQALLNDRLGQA